MSPGVGPAAGDWPEPARAALAGLEQFMGSRAFDAGGVRAAVAPGRVNLLGGHTDYSEGFVLPAAVDRHVACVHAPPAGSSGDGLICLSLDFDDVFTVPLTSLGQVQADEGRFEEMIGGAATRWRRYVLGVVLEMDAAGIGIPPGTLVVSGDVPVAAGLSSSAALECAVYTALAPEGTPDAQAARLCQRAEHRWAGVPCGIMDQYASLFGEEGAALFLDCRAVTHRRVPFPAGAAITVVHSGVRRELASGMYAQRRAEVETAVEILRKVTGPIRTLRDVDPRDFEEAGDILPQPLRRRARHVVEAIARVPEGAGLLALGDLEGFGALMYACHEGLARLFEVSIPELDTIVEAARRTGGVWGARLTGAGFGGGCVVLHREGCEQALEEAVRAAFVPRFPDTLGFHRLRAVRGAHRLDAPGGA